MHRVCTNIEHARADIERHSLSLARARILAQIISRNRAVFVSVCLSALVCGSVYVWQHSLLLVYCLTLHYCVWQFSLQRRVGELQEMLQSGMLELVIY